MIRGYIGRRVLQFAPAVAGIIVLAFLLIHLAPGDPIVALAGESGDAEYYAFMRERFGLDRPLPVQFATYAGNLLRGDLGTSYVQGRPVVSIVTERFAATLLLAVTALVISSVAGVAIGAFAASRAHGLRDIAVTSVTLGLYAAPVFFIAQIALLWLAFRLGWFPIQGMTSPGKGATGVSGVLGVAHHLVLPALVLASQEIAAIARLTRTGVHQELTEDYIRTARAKGLGERAVMGHALRRALLPVVTVIGSRVGHLLSGAAVVEVVFGWPGIGRLLVTASQNRDAPILLGIFLFVAMTVVVANLFTDLAYGWLDPRIRLR